MEHGDLEWIYSLKMVMFHSFLYVYQRATMVMEKDEACGENLGKLWDTLR